MNNGIKKKTLKATVLFGLILIYCIFRIVTFTPSSLFGNLGVGKYYICGGVCFFLLYLVWLIYAVDYVEKNPNKKTRFFPLIILIIFGILIGFAFKLFK